jgi:hypothetical protein
MEPSSAFYAANGLTSKGGFTSKFSTDTRRLPESMSSGSCPELLFPKRPSLENKLCLDLCSGKGGFSQAFVQAGWKVITVDIEPKFEPSLVADVTKIDWEWFKQEYLNGESLDVLLASPPCNHFSLACLQFPRKGVQSAFEIVGACFEAIAYLKPKKWLIENPRGRLRWLIGTPKQTIRYSDYDSAIKMMKTTDLWGNIPLPMVRHERRITRTKGLTHLQRLRLFPANAKLSAERAMIPLGVSQAVLQGVEAC